MNTNNSVTRATDYLNLFSPEEDSKVLDLLDSLHTIEFIEIVEETLGTILTNDEIIACISLSVGEVSQYLIDLAMRR